MKKNWSTIECHLCNKTIELIHSEFYSLDVSMYEDAGVGNRSKIIYLICNECRGSKDLDSKLRIIYELKLL